MFFYDFFFLQCTKFLIFPKWQHGMEKDMTHTHTHTHAWQCVSEAWSVWCVLMCPLCAAGAKHWWQGRQKLCVCVCPLVCVKVCSVKYPTPDSDRLRSSVERSRLRRVFSIHSRDRTHALKHTHTHAVVCSGCQCGLQPIITPCRESQANQTRLALPRTLRAEGLDLHNSSEQLRKMLFVGKSLPQQLWRSEVKAWSWKKGSAAAM